MQGCYYDYYSSRLALVDLIPQARYYPLLFSGWMTDEQLMALVPDSHPKKTETFMKHCWFKAQLLSRGGPPPEANNNLYHPLVYVRHIPVSTGNAIPMISYIDEALGKLGGTQYLLDVVMGKLDHVPASIHIRLWADELQALFWGMRIRPSDENTRTIYALYHHMLHGSQQVFQCHLTDSRCICADCRRHNVACTCVSCIEHRKASLVASQVRHSITN